jgi:hypothetical protein
VKLEHDRLTRLVFDHDYELCIDNWCSEIKSIMTSLDILNTFHNKSTVDRKTVESKLKNLYNTQWSDMVERSPKLRTYKTFKSSFKTEDNVLLNLSKYKRSLMAQF